MGKFDESLKKRLWDDCNKEYNTSITKFAIAIGVPPGSLWRYMNEDDAGLTSATLEKVLNFLGGKLTWEMQEDSRFEKVARMKIVDGELVVDREMSELIFRKDWLDQRCLCEVDGLFVMHVDSQDMVPVINPGDSIMVEKCEDIPFEEGTIYLFKKNGEFYLRRFHTTLSGGLLATDNRKIFWNDIQVGDKSTHDTLGLTLVGRVVWVAREL